MIWPFWQKPHCGTCSSIQACCRGCNSPSLAIPSSVVISPLTLEVGVMHDRVAAPQIRMTQQFLAHMLGARTASVNEAVQKLEAANVIGHRRQEISVLDRKGLEAMACECYATVRRVYEQAILN